MKNSVAYQSQSRSSVGILLMALLLFIFMYKTGVSQDRWNYRVPIDLVNVPNETVAIPLSIPIGAIIEQGKVWPDGRDIRFTQSPCDESNFLNYWIESIEPFQGIERLNVWVKLPKGPEPIDEIFMLYGNDRDGLPSYSDGKETFPFFDDFLGEKLDTDLWSVSGNGKVTVKGVVQIESPNFATIQTDTSYSTAQMLRCKVDSQRGDFFQIAQRNDSESGACITFIKKGEYLFSGLTPSCLAGNMVHDIEQGQKVEITEEVPPPFGPIWFIQQRDTVIASWNDRGFDTLLNTNHKVERTGFSLGIVDTGCTNTDTGYVEIDWVFITPRISGDFLYSVGEETERERAFFSYDRGDSMKVRFTDRSSGYVNSWKWNFGNGEGTCCLEDTVEHKYDTDGLFQVTLTVSGTCFTDSIRREVDVYPIGLKEVQFAKDIEVFFDQKGKMLSINTPSNAFVTLVDLQGRVLTAGQFNRSFTADLGIYRNRLKYFMVYVSDAQGRSFRRLIIYQV